MVDVILKWILTPQILNAHLYVSLFEREGEKQTIMKEGKVMREGQAKKRGKRRRR
jgi:hypothetical protein